MVAKCQLCGYRFDTKSARGLCSSCPIGRNCDKICCPNCHYSWVEKTSLVDKFIRFTRKGASRGRP